MADEALFSKLAELGVDARGLATVWADAAALLAAFDAVGRVCTTALVKVDGERKKNVYTVLLSGGALGEDHHRQDGDDLPAMLRAALAWFVTRASR